MRSGSHRALLLSLLVMVGITGVAAPSRATAAAAAPCPTAAPAPPKAPAVSDVHVSGPANFAVMQSMGVNILTGAEGSTTATVRNTKSGSSRNVTLSSDDLVKLHLALDDQGDIYALRYPYTIAKYDATGTQVWVRTATAPLSNVFVLGHGSATIVGAVHRDTPDSEAFRADGSTLPSLAVTGQTFQPLVDGGVAAVTDAGRYVRYYDATGRQRLVVGDREVDNDPSGTGSPVHFYQTGGAAQAPGGRLLIADSQHGLMVLSAAGLLLGTVPPTAIDAQGLPQNAAVTVIGANVYMVTGPKFSGYQNVSRIPLAQVLAAATHGESTVGPRLGIGAGLQTTVTDNYFSASQPAGVSAAFDPWWSTLAPRLQLCWAVRSMDDLRLDRPGASGRLPVQGDAFTPQGVALPFPSPGPGAYQAQAVLQLDGRQISSTSLVFTVGTSQSRLDIDGLPAGADWGGPSPARGVALADELGTGLDRVQLNWNGLLAGGPQADLDFSSVDTTIPAGGAEAARRGTTMEVQLGQGGPESALVRDGTWGARVGQVVSHFKDSVHVWEIWNEPDITYGSASDYVQNVLAPAYEAIKQADPQAVVVGGSTVGVDIGYWQGLIAAGGLQYMDVAGVHPYTGHNRSWEEDGTIDSLQQLQPMLTRPDGSRLTMWNTEQSWISDGPANLVGQADDSARGVLWMHALAIPKWNYFLSEGGWGNDGVSFSAIQVSDFVKPSALAIMNAEGLLKGRPFLGMVATGATGTYGMHFGQVANQPKSRELWVAWTDGMSLRTAVSIGSGSVAATQVDEFGKRRDSVASVDPRPLVLDSAPTYLLVPAGSAVTIRSQESYGPDLLAAGAGATASASSASSRNPASAAIDGSSHAAGDVWGNPLWISAVGDAQPTLTIQLPQPQVLDRVVVATHSIGSIVPGLRDYDVQIQAAGGTWTNVAQVRGQFYHRQQIVAFAATSVVAVRVVVRKVNLSGYNGGSAPSFWPTDQHSLTDPNAVWYGPATVSELYGYAPGNTVEVGSAQS